MPASSGTGSSSRLPIIMLCLALVGAASMLDYYLKLFIPRAVEIRISSGLGHGYSFGNDFYQVWLASREWMECKRDPYSPAMTRDIQIGLYGQPLGPRVIADRRAFPYPAFVEILFWPAALIPFPFVRVLGIFLFAAIAVMTTLMWMKTLSWSPPWPWITVILLLVLCSYPMLEGLYAEQIGLLVGFLLAASIRELQRGRLLSAGILLTLTTMKPQVTTLAIFYLLLWSWRHKRGAAFCRSFAFTLALLAGAALMVWPHWIRGWARIVVEYHGYTAPPLITSILAIPLGPRLAAPIALLVTLALLIASMVLAWQNRAAGADSAQFLLTLSLLFSVTTVALLPGQAIYDHAILLAGIFQIFLRRNELSRGWIPKVLLSIAGVALLWPWMAALALITLRPLLQPAIFYSNAVFALPLRFAAAFPFLVLALLFLILRQKPSAASL